MYFWSSRILKPKIAAAVSRMREKLDTAKSLPIRTAHEFSGAENDDIEEEDNNSNDNDSNYSDNENEYTSSETSGTESDDGNCSGSGNDSHKRKIDFEYTDEELEERRRLSLTLLSGAEFAMLDILNEWFECLRPNQQVNVIWKLVDPSNGGLLLSTRREWKKSRLQRLIDTLNEALNKDKSNKTALTTKSLGYKKSKGPIRRGLRNLLSDPETLKVCLRDCLILHDDETYSVHEIIADDLKTLSDEDQEELETQGFELLNQVDQESNLLP